MKKLLTLLLALSLLLTSAFLFTACDKDDDKDSDKGDDTPKIEMQDVTSEDGTVYSVPKSFTVANNIPGMLMLMDTTTGEAITITSLSEEIDENESINLKEKGYKDEEEFKRVMEVDISSLGITVEEIVITESETANSFTQRVFYKATDLLGEVTYRAYYINVTASNDFVHTTVYTVTENDASHPIASAVLPE